MIHTHTQSYTINAEQVGDRHGSAHRQLLDISKPIWKDGAPPARNQPSTVGHLLGQMGNWIRGEQTDNTRANTLHDPKNKRKRNKQNKTGKQTGKSKKSQLKM